MLHPIRSHVLHPSAEPRAPPTREEKCFRSVKWGFRSIQRTCDTLIHDDMCHFKNRVQRTEKMRAFRNIRFPDGGKMEPRASTPAEPRASSPAEPRASSLSGATCFTRSRMGMKRIPGVRFWVVDRFHQPNHKCRMKKYTRCEKARLKGDQLCAECKKKYIYIPIYI